MRPTAGNELRCFRRTGRIGDRGTVGDCGFDAADAWMRASPLQELELEAHCIWNRSSRFRVELTLQRPQVGQQLARRLVAVVGSLLERLVLLVYEELHRLARRYMRQERPDHTLQATSLVNEPYLRLIDVNRVEWRDRAHFLAVAAR